ncbi:sigma-54-dependent Fis family transcriptional regulator [Janibacter sp. G56]|uniref:sigma-54-dependent Fis family transcriptional regulator n=1 Tax=Janibacter sp. G56 TaxID=3418717 RepID=UPI003D00711E
MEHHVDMERLTPWYFEDPELDTPLVSAATPILDALHEQLGNEAVSLMLTNNQGVILSRRLTHPGLMTRLNRVKLAPGHVFSEESVGTNGIGTALASQCAVTIDGREHFVEDLRDFQCAAVPIFHPTRRLVLGTFNLTTLANTSGAMTMALTRSTAQQIERELARISSRREFRLFGRYLEGCRRMRHGAVLAFNGECLMMNDRLRAAVTGPDQGALLAFARECVLGSSLEWSTTLPSGLHMELRVLDGGDDGDGHVLGVRVVGPSRRRTTKIAAPAIPGLVGSDPMWLRAVTELDAAYTRRDLPCVLGEAGTGKVHLLSALHRRHAGINPVLLHPPGDGGDDTSWLETFDRVAIDERGLVVVCRYHLLSPRLRTALVDRLDHRSHGSGARIALTANPDLIAPEDELIALSDTRCTVPALRHRHADLVALTRHFVRLYSPRGEHVLTSAAQTALARLAWPGNVRQLEGVIRTAVLGAASADRIDVHDLPPECVTNGPLLTHLESVERDAIVRGLQERGGNVVRTARDLGIARATMYRKLRRYGIDPSAI